MGNNNSSNSKLTMKQVEDKYSSMTIDEIIQEYTSTSEKIFQLSKGGAKLSYYAREQIALVLHEFHLFIKFMYKIMEEEEPTDEEDIQNLVEYRESFGNLISFLDHYSKDFKKLLNKKTEMSEFETLSQAVNSSLTKMMEGLSEVDKSINEFSQTIDKYCDEFEVDLFVRDMVREKYTNYHQWRKEERILLALFDSKNHFKALDLSRKPEEELTDINKDFIKLYLKRTITFNEEERENVDKRYFEYYRKVKKLYDDGIVENPIPAIKTV